jgi:hypothetical protein
MKHGPSLTTAQLREIQTRAVEVRSIQAGDHASESDKTRRSADDVIELLWEIRRLHVVLMRADQVARQMRYEFGTEGLLLSALRTELESFPILKEWEASRAEMLRHK